MLEVVPLAGGTFSAQLVAQISELLQKHGFSKNHLDGFAVASGPGSFTGLRVGLAAIKALAEVLGKPIAAVSLLEVVALAARASGKVTAAMDAGRGEVYVGEYEVANGRARFIHEELLGREELACRVVEGVIATPDMNVVNDLAAAVEVQRPRSDAIARLGWEKIQSGEIVSPEELEANYIRRSDAEIFSKPSSR